MTLLTFIIPVRHQDNAVDWTGLATRLAQTVASIAAQTNGDWQGIVVANEGADLLPLPSGFRVERVTFPPNARHDLSSADLEAVYDSFRLDKGRRVLKGMLSAGDTRFFMIVDDDDFVNRKITEYVADHAESPGWKIDEGYRWSDGSKFLMQQPDFTTLCGTSHIIRSDLYTLPDRFEDATEEYIKTMLGSHRRIAEILAERGFALSALPFPGAIYRVGHVGAHSKSQSLFKAYIFNRKALRHPRGLIRNLKRFRLITTALKREFFGATR